MCKSTSGPMGITHKPWPYGLCDKAKSGECKEKCRWAKREQQNPRHIGMSLCNWNYGKLIED